MRILLLGKYGQVGWELHRSLSTLGDVVAVDYPEIDLVESSDIRNLVRQVEPQVIINATAYTAVDKAEIEQDVAVAVNGVAPGILAEEAAEIGAAFIHYSTDYVFDGKKGLPYVETDTPNPLGVYGKTKFHGEEAVQLVGGAYLIFRTSWVYSMRKSNFVLKILQWSRENTTMRIVSDQIANPTWARMLAEITSQVLLLYSQKSEQWLADLSGIYHLAGSGYASRFEWAKQILNSDPRKTEQIVKEILPAKTSEFPSPAQRPLFSALSCEHFSTTFGLSLPKWEESVRLALEN